MLVQQPVNRGYGQGKRAVTLLTEEGCHFPVISEHSYLDRTLVRSHSAPQNAGRMRGIRPMHRTTMTVSKPPWAPEQAYVTTHKQIFSGRKDLNPVRRPPLCPSMHTSQIKLQHPEHESPDRNTHYAHTYHSKPIIPANRLHLTSLVNRIDQTEGADMKESIRVESASAVPNYFSQYNRVHNKLGNVLGTGVARDYPVRQQYNILTGEASGPAWREDNRKVSGDHMLHSLRKEQTSILG